ncbi:MAG: pyruvate ferredoxin oxidoreductase, partial [archaeon]|nr:pyruvate ferredoxin oxidoreductase [archaeon]
DNFGLLKIISLRPFPKKDILSALKNIDCVIVLEKNISLGASNGAIFDEIRSAFYNQEKMPKVISCICGIGGTEVTVDDVIKMANDSKKKKDGFVSWLMKK